MPDETYSPEEFFRLSCIEQNFQEYQSGRKSIYFDEADLEDLFYFEMDKGEEELAREVLQTGRKQHPSSIMFRYLEGVIFDEKGEYETALKIFEAYPDEKDPEWHSLCFSTYCHIPDIEKAKEEATHIIESGGGSDIHYLIYIAKSFFKLQEHSQAVTYLKKAAALNPTEKNDLEALGGLALDLKESHIAYQCAEKILKDEPYCFEAWFTEANALLLEQKFEEALDKLEYVLAIYPGHTQAFLEKIRVLIILNQLSEAERLIAGHKTADRKNGDSVIVALNGILKSYSADIAFLQGEWQKANRLYSTVYKDVDLAPIQLCLFAECKMRSPRWKDAERLLKESIAGDNEIVDSHEHLAEIYLHQRKYDAAAKEFRQCMVLMPNKIPYRLSYSIALLDGNHTKSAIKVLQETIEMSPECWEAHSLIAVIMAVQGKQKEAVVALKKACTIDPKAREAFIQTYPQAEQIIEIMDREDPKPNKDI